MRPVAAIILLSALAAPAVDVIDRIAVSIENKVITESEVIRQIRITALLNSEEPDLSGSSRRETAERLVDQSLIRREIITSGYAPVELTRSAELYKEFRKRFPTDAAYQQTLKKYRLTDADMVAAFQWQATFLDFVELRFRPGITIPEDEIRQYYEEQIKGRGSPETNLSFEESRERIEQILTQQRIDNALDRWLGQSRTQTRIRYRQEAFK